MRPGLIPSVPLEQARAASKAVADESLVEEVKQLQAELRRFQVMVGEILADRDRLEAERDLLRTAAERVADYHENGVGGDLWWEALDALTFAVTPDPELEASMKRHPAGKGRRP